jgi:hypothetical protein
MVAFVGYRPSYSVGADRNEGKRMNTSKATGVVCTVLGGTLGLWVIARLANFVGMQQTWAPPFARYEWVTLLGAAAAALLLIVGLVRWTRPQER